MIQIPRLPGLESNPPASTADISDLEQRMGHQIPEEHRQFLLQADGFSLEGGILLYSTSEIEERNSTWRIPVYLPEYLAIGDTGGGDVILVKYNDDSAGLLICGAGAPFRDMLRKLAPSLEEWFASGCGLPE